MVNRGSFHDPEDATHHVHDSGEVHVSQDFSGLFPDPCPTVSGTLS